MNTKLFSVQKQVATTLLDKLESHEISWERAGEIARTVEILLPDFLADDQIYMAIQDLVRIPELSHIGV